MRDFETKKLDDEILEFIKKYSEMPAPEESFEKLALKIFDYQFRRNELYRKFCLTEGKTPGVIKNWKDIPAMPTVGFKELVLATFPIKNAVKIFNTSGTTQGAKGAHFFDTLKLYEAAILPPFKKYLLSDGADCQFFFLVVSPKEAPHSSLSHMMRVVNQKFSRPKKGKYYVKNGLILFDDLIKDLKSLGKRKAMILATAFSLKAFLDTMKENKILLCLQSGSRLMETGGFKGKAVEVSKEALYAECEKRLGIKKDFCVSEYGMTELSSQFYDTTLRGPVMAGPAWLRTSVVDPRTGKQSKIGAAGILRHFDLANRGSVLAIQTEDLGRAETGGFRLLGRATGVELRGCSLTYEELLETKTA